MPELLWRQTAREDLRSIIAYIAEDNPDAALGLLDEIEAKVSRLPEGPRHYRQGRVAGTREMVVHTNYIVVYSEAPETIVILRVLHAAQLWP